MNDPLPKFVEPFRAIHQADALEWLNEKGILRGCSLITSLPDISEYRALSLSAWKIWFTNAAGRVLSSCPDDGLTIFYQTDIMRDGALINKAFLCQMAAESLGHKMLWHKIVCRNPPGSTSFGRPTYSHLLCFAKSLRSEVKKSTPDVLPSAGEITWTRGMGVEACRIACQTVLDLTHSHTIVDPFCGHGMVLAIANTMGLAAIGVDRSPKCVRRARNLMIMAVGQHTI